MVFMMGMYCAARSPETDRMRIRGFSVIGGILVGSVMSVGLVVAEVVERRRFCLFTYVRARVRAPAMDVVGVRESGWVFAMRVERVVRRVVWMCRKGR